MISLEYIEGHQSVLYKQYKLHFKDGLTLITGQNGSGKSLSCSLISNVLYMQPPALSKKGAARSYHQKGSKLTLAFKNNKHSYALNQHLHGSSLRVDCLKDGKNLKHRTQAGGMEYVSKAFPVSQEQFYLTTYLDAFRSNALISGTPNERYKLFESICDLTIYDHLKEKVGQKAAKVKESGNKKKILENSLTELPKTDPENLKTLKTTIVKLEEELSKSFNLIKKLNVRKLNVESHLKALTALQYPKLSNNQVNTKLKETEKQFKLLSAIVNEAIKNAQLASDIEKVQQKLDAIKVKPEPFLRKQIEKLQIVVDEGEKAVDLLNDLAKDFKAFTKYDKEGYKYDPNSKSSLARLHAKKESWNETLSELSKITGKKECPTCLNTLDHKHVETLSRDIEKLLRINEKKIKTLEIHVHYCDIVEKLAKIFKVNLSSKNSNKLLANAIEQEQQKADAYDKAFDKLEKYQEDYVLAQQRIPLVERLKELGDVPKEALTETQIEANLFKLKQYEVEQAALKKEVTIRELLDSKLSNNKTLLSDELTRITKKILKIQREIDQTQQILVNSKAELETSKINLNRIKSLEEQIEILEKSTRDGEILNHLLAALGPKGVKEKHLGMLLSIFTDGINENTQRIFPRNINFYATVKNGGIHITAERHGKPPTDIALLSGSEKRSFTLLAAISLLQLIPDHKRVDTLIIDEIESGMSKLTKSKLINDLLPVLKKVYRSIIWITPASDQELPVISDYKYEAISKNGYSILKQK